MTEDFYCDEVFSGKRPVEKVFETDDVLAYHHTRPFWETHIVVVPKVHVDSLLMVEVFAASQTKRLRSGQNQLFASKTFPFG